jgi:hypothetical protein
MRRFLIIVMAVAVSLISFSTVHASSALAAGCWASGCRGYDPEYMGCADSSTQSLESVTAPGGMPTVTLRYSGSCDAAWARGDHYWANIEVQESTDRVHLVAAYDVSVSDSIDDVDWTYMVSFGDWTRACVEAYASNQWVCTGWH